MPPLQGDWATLAATDEWEESHQKSKLSRQTPHTPNLLAASCCDDGNLIVWKPLEFTALSTLCGHSDRVVSISTDKTRVCTASLDRTVRLWPLDQSVGKELNQHEGPIQSLSVSPHKRYCLSASWDGCVKLWNCTGLNEKRRTPTLVISHQAHANYLTAAALSHDVTRLATSTADGDLVVWRLEEASEWDVKPYIEHEKSYKLASPVYCMSWLDEGLLVLGTDTGLVYLLHPQHGILASLQSHHDRPIHQMNPKPGNDHVIQTVSTSGHVTEITINVTQPAKKKKDVKSKRSGPVAVPVATPVYTLSEEQVCDDPDIQCRTTTPGGDWYGLSDGTVTLTEFDEECNHQLSRHGVTGLCCYGDHVVTIDDKNVRVVKGTEDAINQLGHYVTEAPLKHVRVFPPSGDGDRFAFVCGDQLGNVLFLQWNP